MASPFFVCIIINNVPFFLLASQWFVLDIKVLSRDINAPFVFNVKKA